MRRNKIAILLPNLAAGGAERVSLDLARAFQSQGQEVQFWLMSAHGQLLREARDQFEVVELRVKQARWVPFAVARCLTSERPDALVANMWPLTAAAVVGRVLSRHGCRLLLVDHTALSSAYASWGRVHSAMLRASMSATYRLADAVGGVSRGVTRDIERLAALPRGSVSVLYNPIPQRGAPSEEARRRAEVLWKGGNGERILSVGSLVEAKNQSLLLRAFAKIRRPASTLMFVGQGPLESMLRDLARELGVSDRVVFAGFQGDPVPFYASADLFVLSSNYEGLPTVLIEALSFGVPVVSTNCPFGPSEILKDGRWGRLTPVGDVAALALAMDEALSTPVDHEALKRRAADFSPEIAARKYLDLLGLP